MKSTLIICVLLFILGCQQQQPSVNLLTDIDPDPNGQMVNMVVEIPAGSTEKWEVNKLTGLLEPDSLNGQPRIINYLAYPGNYGFIPKTILPKAKGGDGDPLDILVIGESVARGEILRCKVIGVLKLLDAGEMDDKLIAVSSDSSLSDIDNIRELRANFPGMLDIIETWFINYKGAGKMESNGFRDLNEALAILEVALQSF